MPTLSDEAFVQQATGQDTVATANHVVTLPSGTTAGNSVIVIMCGGLSYTLPSTDWYLVRNGSTSTMRIWILPQAPSGTTTWTFTEGGTDKAVWYAAEIAGLDTTDPIDAGFSPGSGITVGNGGTASTGTSAMTVGLTAVAFAVWNIDANSGTTSMSGYTNGFEEVADVSVDSGTATDGLAVARRVLNNATSTLESTATLTTSGASTTVERMVFSLRAAEAPIVTPLYAFVGFEWGTHGGASTANLWGSALGPTGTWGTSYLIQAGSARNGSYGLRLVQSASTAQVRVGSGGTSIYTATAGFNVRVVSGTGTVVVAEIGDVGTTRCAQLVYDVTNVRFGVRAGTTGTVSWQAGTTALNTWVWVDMRARTTSTTWRAEWRLETGANTYTGQTAAELAGQTRYTAVNTVFLGGNVSQTVTADFDDVCTSSYWSAFPLGPQVVRLLTVDTAATPTLSGTTTNFSTFTNNGTLAAWNATTARNNIDEVPPTISASADGFTQTAVATGDYVELPMATYTLTAAEVITGVRAYAAIWAASAAAAHIAIRGWDGTTETVLDNPAAYTPGTGTAISSTNPTWRAATWPSTNGWTQAELTAAALRIGYSSDATPDIGVHAVYLEVAVGKTRSRTLFGDAATAQEDPNRLGVVSIGVTGPVTGTGVNTVLEYGPLGSETVVQVTPGGTVTEQINAAFDADVPRITAHFPPEPDPTA